MNIYFEFQSAFMNDQNQHLDTLQDIKQMMERSSRFISLSGLSGIAAGTCALIGAWFAYGVINNPASAETSLRNSEVILYDSRVSIRDFTGSSLLQIAIVTLLAALVSAFIFTYLRSRKTGTTLLSKTSIRLLINVSIPLIVGGIYLFRLMTFKIYGLIAPGCLIFYGLALLNASKYTLKEIRYLGICEILLGILNLWHIGHGLYYWAIGFGVLHIIYGAAMWWEYERKK
jgi:hypothetical protein